MSIFTSAKKNGPARKISAALTALAFMFTSLISPDTFAQPAFGASLNLPAPGTLISITPAYTPALLKGIIVHPEDQLLFDFIVERGDGQLEGEALKEESEKLIKYFLASLTVPEEELWVNLSPYEKDRVIPRGFGETEMGRDLLAQDYILKQLTASLMHPQEETGAAFWDKIYARVKDRHGISDIPLSTFNKIWIVPEKAVIYESGQGAFVAKSRLKVMLEEDYFALETEVLKNRAGQRPDVRSTSRELTAVIKEILIPEIEKEVNQGKNFAGLRQIYHSLILAAWFKGRLKESLLGKVYADRNKTRGVDHEDREINETIYQQYLAAFKEGAYNYIKEDYDPATRQVVARKYFSGGTALKTSEMLEIHPDQAVLVEKEGPLNLGKAVLVTSQQVEFGPNQTKASIKNALDFAMTGQQGDGGSSGARETRGNMIEITGKDRSSLTFGGIDKFPDSFIRNNRTFVRPDLNVPLTKDGVILDDNRIKASLPTIKQILDKNGEIVLGAHLGRPQEVVKKLLNKNPGLSRAEAEKIVREELSLEPVMRRLSEILAREGYRPEIFFDPGWTTTRDVPREVIEKKSRSGKIIFLENLRFNPGEEALPRARKALRLAEKENETSGNEASRIKVEAARQKVTEAEKLYEKLSADYFDPRLVNAFILDGPGVEHNEGQPSVDGAPPTMPRAAGLLLKNELLTIRKILPRLEVVIMGGSKVSDKINAIKKIREQPGIRAVAVVGAMANAFLKAASDREVENTRESGHKARPIRLGKSIGASPEEVAIAREYLDDPKIILPVDVIIAESFEPGAKTRTVSVESLKDGSYLTRLTRAKMDAAGNVETKFTGLDNWLIVDIGPQSRQNIKEIIEEIPEGGAVMNNGPAGAFELPHASGGTFEILESMNKAASRGVIPVVGGGESGMAVLQKGYENILVMTGGQSTLKLIELWGEYDKLAGLKALSTPEELEKFLRIWRGIARPISDEDLRTAKKELWSELFGEDGYPQGAAEHARPGAPQKYGGINLNPALLDLQIRRDGNGAPLPVSEQPFETMRIEGFVPVIINVAPISNLPMLLGLNPESIAVPEQPAQNAANI
jgi:phosphoglycerate kinase